jgi:hypothetical protein
LHIADGPGAVDQRTVALLATSDSKEKRIEKAAATAANCEIKGPDTLTLNTVLQRLYWGQLRKTLECIPATFGSTSARILSTADCRMMFLLRVLALVLNKKNKNPINQQLETYDLPWLFRIIHVRTRQCQLVPPRWNIHSYGTMHAISLAFFW